MEPSNFQREESLLMRLSFLTLGWLGAALAEEHGVCHGLGDVTCVYQCWHVGQMCVPWLWREKSIST